MIEELFSIAWIACVTESASRDPSVHIFLSKWSRNNCSTSVFHQAHSKLVSIEDRPDCTTMMMKSWSSYLCTSLLLLAVDRSLARVGSDASSKYQIKERKLETLIIDADELEDFLLTFSLDSEPKLLSAFTLDLFTTDGNLLPESLETCANVLNEWLQPILSDQFKHDTVKLVETTINSQQGLTSPDQGEIDGTSLNLRIAVTFRHEPSPKDDDVEEAVRTIMQDMSGYVEALAIRARELEHEELYDVTAVTRREEAGDSVGVVNDVQTTSDGGSGVEQPVVVTTALVGGIVVVAAAMLLVSRMKREKEAETDAASSLRQVNVFVDGEEDDIFSFEAALIESPTSSKPGAQLMSPESLDSIESTTSNEFLTVDLSTPTPNKKKKPRHLRSTSVKKTTPKQSNPVFGYFSGILNHTQRQERKASQNLSNQVTMSPMYIFSEEEDVESISESGSQRYLGSSNSKSHSSESAEGPLSPTHYEYNTMTLDELLVEKYSENNDVDYVSSVDTTPTKDESKRIKSRMRNQQANFDDTRSPGSCVLSPKPPLYRSPPAKTPVSQRTNAPGQVYLSTSPELQKTQNSQSHSGVSRNPIVCSSRNKETIDEGHEIHISKISKSTDEKSRGVHHERYQVEEDIDYDAEESSQEGSDVYEESPDDDIILDEKKKPKGVSSRLSALANFLRGKSLSPRKKAQNENNLEGSSSPDPVSSPPENEQWISPSSSQSSRSRREAVPPPQEVWNQGLFAKQTVHLASDQQDKSSDMAHNHMQGKAGEENPSSQGAPRAATKTEDGALEWGLDKYAQRRYAKSPSPQRTKTSSHYVMQPEPNPKRRAKSASPSRKVPKHDEHNPIHNRRTYQVSDDQLESADLYLSSEGEGQTSDSSGLVGELLQSSSSEQYGESDVSKSDQSSIMYNSSPQKQDQSGTSVSSIMGAAAMAASTFGWALGAKSAQSSNDKYAQHHDHYTIPEEEDETSSSSANGENDAAADRKLQAKAKQAASETNGKPGTVWTTRTSQSSRNASPRTSPRKSPRSPEQQSHQRSLFAKRLRKSTETETKRAQKDPPSTPQSFTQSMYGALPTPNNGAARTHFSAVDSATMQMNAGARPPMQSSPSRQLGSQPSSRRYHHTRSASDGSLEYQEHAGSEPDSPPPVDSPPRGFDLQGDTSSPYQRQSDKRVGLVHTSPSMSKTHHSSPTVLDGSTEYQTHAGSEPDSPPGVESPRAPYPYYRSSPNHNTRKTTQVKVKSPSPSRRHATSPLVDGTNEYQEQVESAVSEDSPERNYDYLPGERLHAQYFVANRATAPPPARVQPDFSNRRHAMSSAVDGSTDYQAALQQRDGNSFEASVSLSDSDVPSPMDSATPQSLSTSNTTSDGALGGMQYLSSGNSGSSSDALSTRHGRRLLDDLVWLERKIAGAGGTLSPYSPSSSSFTGLSHSHSSSSSQALDEKIEVVLHRDDSLSFASVDGYVDSASETSVGEPKEAAPAIICKDCYAPPGKLRIVIHSTKDGPAVHTVKEGSVLLGHLFPGDIIVAVDDADTRAFTAEQVMRIMTARTNQERKITVLRLQQEPPTPTKKRRMA